MRILKMSFYGFVVILTGFLAWYFPMQRILALKAFKRYINAQGVEKSDISKMRVFKDYKRDGYVINVWYKDEPSLRYEYKWFVNGASMSRNIYIYNVILNIYDATDTHIEVKNKIMPKYPPLT